MSDSIRNDIVRYQPQAKPQATPEEYPLRQWQEFVRDTAADVFEDLLSLFSDDLIYPNPYEDEDGLLPWTKDIQLAAQHELLSRLLGFAWMSRFGGQKRIEGAGGEKPCEKAVRKLLKELYKRNCTYDSDELLRASAAATGLRVLFDALKKVRKTENARIRAASGPITITDEDDGEDDLYNGD